MQLNPRPERLDLNDLLEEVASAVEDTVRASGPDDADEAPLWEPFKGPQTMALESEADELFYGGAGGGGKTDLVLGAAITRHKSSVIFRTEFGQFRGPEGAIERSKEILGTPERFNASTFQWRGLPGGRSFEFAGVRMEKDLGKWKGRAHDLKAFDELPDFKELHYRFLIGWLRTSIQGQRTRVISTGNPPTTAEGQWVIRYWAPWLDKQHPNPAKPGELRWYAAINGKDVERPNREPFWSGGEETCVHVFDEYQTSCQTCRALFVRPRSRTFIPARVEDNPVYMRTGYVDVLNSLPEPLRSQLRFGDFQKAQDDNPWQVIPTLHVQMAQARWRANPRPPENTPLTAVGVDPSRGGKDKFCLVKRYANWVDLVERHEATEAPDGQAGARLIQKLLLAELERTGDDGVMDAWVNIDVIGIGSWVFEQARDLGLQAVGFNSSEKTKELDASGRLKFWDKRSLWWWRLREWLAPDSGVDLALPPDAEVLSDLCSARWKITPRGIQVEGKEDIKERIGRSPDAGEAVIYAINEDGGNGLGFLQFAADQVASDKLERKLAREAAAEALEDDEKNPWLED